MFKEFNVKFENVEILGGADNLLEGTEVTKVVIRGDSKMSSLDSAFKNCSELDTIDGQIDLNGIADIDNMLEGSELVKKIDLKNINNEKISVNNSFPNVEEINIGGELYNKSAIQNVIASKDWTFDNIKYKDIVGDNIVTKEVDIVDDNKVTIQDTLEQKVKGIEIIGQTYENLVVGNEEVTLIDELVLESVEGSPKEFNPHVEQPVCVEVVEGNTVQDESNIYSIGELQEDGTYKIDILSHSDNDFDFDSYSASSTVDKIENKFIFNNGSMRDHLLYIGGFGIIKPNETIYVNVKVEIKNITGNGRFRVGLGDKTAVWYQFYNLFQDISTSNPNATYNLKGLLKNNSTKDLYLYLCGSSNGNVGGNVIFSDIYVSRSKQLDTYVRYGNCKKSILLPQPLNKIGVIKDKFYWDEDKGHYCIEQNVSKELEVMASPNIIDLPHLNKKYSLDTYMPTTYLECTNSPMQPSKMTLKSDIVKYKPIFLDQNKEYQVKFDCKQKGNSIKLRLGGTEKTITPALGENTVSITTPQEIVDSRLYLIGANNKLSNVYVIADNMSTGELQEDGTYKIDISTSSGGLKGNLFNIDNFFVNSNNRGEIVVSKEDNSITSNYTDWFYTIETNIDVKSKKEYLITLDVEYLNHAGGSYPIIMIGNKGYNLNAYNHGDFIKIIQHQPDGTLLNASLSAKYTPTEDATVYLGLSTGIRRSGSIKIKNLEIREVIPLISNEISISSKSPLSDGNKLYWSSVNKRYEIDRNGEIEVPIVEGDTIDLPRLYQRETTNIKIETGNIKPGEIKIEYLDID